MADRNHRRNQQDGETRYKVIGGVNGDVSAEWEEHEVKLWPDADFYGIQLTEAPIRGDGIPTMLLYRRISVDPEDDILLEEVELEIDPDSGQYAVDYEEAGFDGTGRIFMPPSALGWTIIARRYAAMGEILKDADDLTLEGDLTVGGVIQDLNGDPVMGYITHNGELQPYYGKEIDFTYDTDGSTSFAHGLANAQTNDRIMDVSVRDTVGTGKLADQVTAISWDDTNIIIAAVITPARAATATVLYFRDA